MSKLHFNYVDYLGKISSLKIFKFVLNPFTTVKIKQLLANEFNAFNFGELIIWFTRREHNGMEFFYVLSNFGTFFLYLNFLSQQGRPVKEIFSFLNFFHSFIMKMYTFSVKTQYNTAKSITICMWKNHLFII